MSNAVKIFKTQQNKTTFSIAKYPIWNVIKNADYFQYYYLHTHKTVDLAYTTNRKETKLKRHYITHHTDADDQDLLATSENKLQRAVRGLNHILQNRLLISTFRETKQNIGTLKRN